MFYCSPNCRLVSSYQVLLEISRHGLLLPRAMGTQQNSLSLWRKVRKTNLCWIATNIHCYILCSFYYSVYSLLIILQFEKDEKSNPLPPCRGRPFSSISCCSTGISPCRQWRNPAVTRLWCSLVATSGAVIFFNVFLFQVSRTCFAHLFQMYEVAVSAQNAERVKLEPFEGSKGYLHNGLYRDPKLPGVLRWRLISLMILKVIIFWGPKSVNLSCDNGISTTAFSFELLLCRNFVLSL